MDFSFFIFSIFILIAFIALFFYNDYLKSLFKSKKIYIDNKLKKIKNNDFNEIKMSELPTNIRTLISNVVFETGLPIYGLYERDSIIYILFLFTEENKDMLLFFDKLIPFLKKQDIRLNNKLKIIIPKENKKYILRLLKKKKQKSFYFNIWHKYIMFV